MYKRYAELSHLPNVFIRESSTPLAAAVDAAPIWKLCPENLLASIPDSLRAFRTLLTNDARVSAVPD